MRNFWVQNEFTIAAWYADVTVLVDRPDALVTLVRAVYDAAAETRMICPRGFDPSVVVSERWLSEQIVDVFRLLDESSVETDLTWFDTSDRITDGSVRDLGELLESLQPSPNSITPANRAVGQPPVTLGGMQIRYSDGHPLAPPRSVSFGIELYSDIWFPYVLGGSHPAADGKRFFDNRDLAERHTPRFNTFLQTIVQLVADAGGIWQIDEGGSVPAHRPWISPTGIKLDLPALDLMPLSCLDVEWPNLDPE